MKCKKCATVIQNNAKFCPECGTKILYKNMQKNEDIQENMQGITAQDKLINDDLVQEDTTTNTKTNNKMIILVLVSITIIILVIFYANKNILYGDEKVAYELILKASYDFKSPRSVRLISGTLSVDKKSIFARLSAINGFGAAGTGYYYINKSLGVMKIKDGGYLYENVNDLNIQKINKALKKNFE